MKKKVVTAVMCGLNVCGPTNQPTNRRTDGHDLLEKLKLREDAEVQLTDVVTF